MIKDCGWKGTLCTRAYAGILKKNPQAKIVPCKKCNNVEPWRSAAGFQNFLRVLEFYQETRYYKAAITLEEWLQKVVNLKSKVPVQCAICDEIREVRISNIQQGASVGCGCFRSSYALEAELAKIIPSVIVRREVKLHGGLKMDFAYFFEGNSVINQEQYQKACHDLRVVPQTQPVKIGIELDGRQHFSGIIFSEHNEQIGLRDLKKDAIACESNVSLIRLQQTSVWENVPYWKDFLREALTYAVSHSGGRVLCEDVANYTESGQYASMRSSGKLSTLRRSEKLPHGVIRELMASSCK
jgi:ribosomal protein S26